jgi:hypothetical protein
MGGSMRTCAPILFPAFSSPLSYPYS